MNTGRFICTGCAVPVICDPDPSHYDAGPTKDQVEQRRCTACYRKQTRSRASA